MSRIELTRGTPHRRNALPRLTLLAGCLVFLVGCFHGPTVYKGKDQVTIDRRVLEYPAGFDMKLVGTGFSAPIALAYDADGTQFVAEAGIEGDEPRIFAIKPDGSLTVV